MKLEQRVWQRVGYSKSFERRPYGPDYDPRILSPAADNKTSDDNVIACPDETARADVSKYREVQGISLHDSNSCRIRFPSQDCSVRSKARSWTERAGSAKRDDGRFRIDG